MAIAGSKGAGGAEVTTCVSSVESAGRPGIALHQDFAVGRHAGLGEPDAALQLQLHAHHLLHAIVAEVGVFGRERGLRIDALDVRVERFCGAESR